MTHLMDRDKLRAQLTRDEGDRASVYQDSRGYWTIGVGRCVDARLHAGLTHDERQYLLSGDIDRAIRALVLYPWFGDLDPVRQAALVNVVFNVGPLGFAKFTRTIFALASKNYATAADELLASRAATENPARYHELSAQLRSGRWQV